MCADPVSKPEFAEAERVRPDLRRWGGRLVVSIVLDRMDSAPYSYRQYSVYPLFTVGQLYVRV